MKIITSCPLCELISTGVTGQMPITPACVYFADPSARARNDVASYNDQVLYATDEDYL